MGTSKHLYILRHAKSGWDDPGRSDRDRSLTIRGIKDIQLMGKTFREELHEIEQILTSHANRAVHTAILLATSANLPLDRIRITDKLYEAEESQVLKVIRRLPDDYSHVMIVGHNPSFSMVASEFIPDLSADIPTSALVRVRFKAQQWSDVSAGDVEWSAFDCPKKFKE